jgi:hypothetical protein
LVLANNLIKFNQFGVRMPIAVVLYLSDDGQMSIGEVEADDVDATQFQTVESFEEAVPVAEQLLLGEAPPPEIEENAFAASVNAPKTDPLLAEE